MESALELCQYAEDLVEASDSLEMVFPRPSFNICFRFKAPKKIVNQLNLAIRDTLYHEGKSLVGYAWDNDRLFLRLLLAGHHLEPKDIDTYLSTLVETGKSLEGEFHG